MCGGTMSYEVQVNGSQGPYDKKVSDQSVRYGRNAVENNLSYMEAPLVNDVPNPAPILNYSTDPNAIDKNIENIEKFVDKNDEYLNSLPPLQYEYRYIPNFVNRQIDKKALLGAAYEEMGGVKELPVKEFEQRYMIDDSMTAEPLDINKDGKIDISEYGANMIAADVLSKDTNDISKADGSINTKGMNAIIAYTKKSNAQAAANLYAKIYDTYGLNGSINSFNP